VAIVERRTLLERAAALETLGTAFASAAAGEGRLLFVTGESGVGKTAVVRAFADGVEQPVRWGACDPLSTPVPLAPFVDVAERCGPALRSVLTQPCTAHDVFAALRGDLADERSVLVIEDAHWADEATLDVLRILGRRITTMPLLVLVTHRNDLGPAGDPLRVALGDLAGAGGVSRVAIEPLTAAAVRLLAEGHGVDPDELYRRTAGNPFYVTEVLEAGDDAVPSTVRDAVLARRSRLDPGNREVLDVIACSPQPVEPWLLEAVCGDCGDAVTAGLAAGMIVEREGAVAYRHEIAREAVADDLPGARRAGIHRLILGGLTAAAGEIDPARLAHHAELADDAPATVRYATAAATRAAAVGAHLQAAAQYGRALRYAETIPTVDRAELHERRAAAHYLADEQLASIADLHAAIALHRAAGDVGREVQATALLVPRLTCRGLVDEARAVAEGALELLGGTPRRETAGALAALAHMYLVLDQLGDAVEAGERAVEAATASGDEGVAIDAAITIGTAEGLRDGPTATGRLETTLALVRAGGHDASLPRALNNFALTALVWRDHPAAERWIAEGLAYVEGQDLDLWRLSILSMRLRTHLNRGRWSEATEMAVALLADERDSPGPRAEGLMVLALVRARRGDPAPPGALADAAALIPDPTGRIEIASAEAEVAWLDGRTADIGPLTDETFALAAARDSPWPLAELALWRHRAGIDVQVDRLLPEPVALEIAGRPVEAAAAWDRLDSPYEAAVALCLADDVAAIADAHGRLQDLGAGAATKIAARRLRERGVRGVARGPRPTTRNNAALLTTREVSVLALLADGLSNARVAERLFVSPRTVDYHVSAILRKLDARSRGEAVASARLLGLLEPR
jgi:DNA-binding CsgD family transcriptional regulator/tetratricopeptide (TPR) repeat protein